MSPWYWRPAGVEADAAWVAIEQRGPQVRFQHADAVGDGAGRDAQLLGGAHKILVARGGVKVAQALQRWKFGHLGETGDRQNILCHSTNMFVS